MVDIPLNPTKTNHIYIYIYKEYLALNNLQNGSAIKHNQIRQGKPDYRTTHCYTGKLISICLCPGYDTKQPDGDVPVMLELWGMWSTPLLPSHPGPLWSRVVAPDMGPIYGTNRTKPCFLHYTEFCI